MKTIAEKRLKLENKLIKLGCKLQLLKDTCDHLGVHYTYGADTGNYSTADNRYWIDWFCPHCTKQWQTPQNKESRYLIDDLQAVKI